MNLNTRKILMGLFIGLALFSCRSYQARFQAYPLYGMVYDYDNNPCKNLKLEAIPLQETGEEKKIKERVYSRYAVSDAKGRFVFPRLYYGDYILKAQKKDYEKIHFELAFSSKSQVLYLKAFSLDQILRLAEKSLREADYETAWEYLIRAEKIDENSPVLLFSKALYYYKTAQAKEALTQLFKLKDIPFNQAEIDLLMADIYLRHFTDPEKALAVLKSSQYAGTNPLIKKKIQQLQSKEEKP